MIYQCSNGNYRILSIRKIRRGGDKISNNRKIELLELLYKHLKGLDAWVCLVAQLDLDNVLNNSSIQKKLKRMLDQSEKYQSDVSYWIKQLKGEETIPTAEFHPLADYEIIDGDDHEQKKV